MLRLYIILVPRIFAMIASGHIINFSSKSTCLLIKSMCNDHLKSAVALEIRLCFFSVSLVKRWCLIGYYGLLHFTNGHWTLMFNKTIVLLIKHYSLKMCPSSTCPNYSCYHQSHLYQPLLQLLHFVVWCFHNPKIYFLYTDGCKDQKRREQYC